ncbi:MAG TPA: sigma 54-interacting transcriptional regulator [Humisphaera sp.]|jgi:PAS domain S-box-containing protein|nr:sigma 54-interacting transcriptional regulator [Humisphaera sp.]
MGSIDQTSGVSTAAPSEVEVLRAIVEGTASAVGDEFFRKLVFHLAKVMDVGYAFVAEFSGEFRARTLAYWKPHGFEQTIEWDLIDTPCEEVVKGNFCHHETGVSQKFPKDEPLVQWGIDSYLGVPLRAADGRHMGHLAVFDTRPMPADPRKIMMFQIFAARAGAELARLRAEQQLRESEDRLRDLFDEAPIAYVHEDIQSKFLRANRAAMRTLGITPEQVEGTYGHSFIPDTPEARRHFDEAFASIGKGTDTSGVVLELRRKDNGKPIWIQWWSRPDPSGSYTRTMFVDITARVLAEQEKARLTAQNNYLQEEIKSLHNFEEIVGRSPAILESIEKVNRVAKTDASVLITGETGTGKELFARAIHSASRRHDKPLIKLNCAALPTSLVESELFGHEKGAFSGAINRRIGRFELANGGTIFLDEIGEVPMEVQVKLLRILQEREFERVGGSEPIKADVRIIAATNRDLPAAIRAGKFREDLYYRLNVFPLVLPPLRMRTGDVPLLVQFLVSKFAGRIGRPIESIHPATMERLNAYRWPGNIRELENVLERAIILSNGPVLEIDAEVFGGHHSEATSGAGPASHPASDTAPHVAADSSLSNPQSLELMERNHVLNVLKRTNWVIDGPSGAAKILDLHPNTLRSRLKKLGLTRAAHEAS